jgi:hypothetical protein
MLTFLGDQGHGHGALHDVHLAWEEDSERMFLNAVACVLLCLIIGDLYLLLRGSRYVKRDHLTVLLFYVLFPAFALLIAVINFCNKCGSG